MYRRLARVLVGLLLAVFVAFGQPVNDDFDNAIVVTAIPFTYHENIRSATHAPGDPDCFGWGPGPNVWFAFTPPAEICAARASSAAWSANCTSISPAVTGWGSVEVNTFGSSFDTALSVLTGTRGMLECLWTNDDWGGLQSLIRFTATAGITYYIQVGTFSGSPGGDLSFTIREPAPIRYIQSVTDAASYTEGIARGAMFVVKGLFGLPDGLRQPGLPLPQQFHGVSVQLASQTGGETLNGWIHYLYGGTGGQPDQIAAVLPSRTAPGVYDVSVRSGDLTITGGSAVVVSHKYRSLSNSQDGLGTAVLQNHVRPGRVDRNMFVAGTLSDRQTAAPAQPGQTVILWGLGLGPIAGPDNDAPGVLDLRGTVSVEIAVGGVPATVLYAGRSPEFPGIDQINFTLPVDAPEGCNIAVEVLVNGEASNWVTMAIAPPGADACEHPLLSRQQLEALVQGESFTAGEFYLWMLLAPIDLTANSPAAQGHAAIGSFEPMTAARAGLFDGRSVAPGRCTLLRGRGPGAGIAFESGANSYHAGRVALWGPGMTDIPLDQDDDFYWRVLALLSESGAPLGNDANYPIVPGLYTLRGAGGLDIGVFEASVSVPQPLQWTNRTAIAEVRREAGVEVTWTGAGAAERVFVQGYVETQVYGRTEPDVATFVCVAPPGATAFTVPARILTRVPDTAGFGSLGVLMVGILNNHSAGRFEAPLSGGGRTGLGVFGYALEAGKILPYR